MKLSAKAKKWIAVIAMVILAATQITTPIDLKSFIPTWVYNPTFGNFSLLNIAAYAVLIAAYWVAMKQTE